MNGKPIIYYTLTDEAPYLATHSLFPVLQRFMRTAGVELQLKNISLSGRILAAFSQQLPEKYRVSDDLDFLGKLTLSPEANIIKLPNISASLPQLLAAIKELQQQGIPLPDYPENPQNEQEKKVKALYDKVKGSAVNPVLRQGNSDRRAPLAVKNYAQKNPHSMGQWSASSQTEVATMQHGDFRHNERSFTAPKAGEIRIELHTEKDEVHVLKEKISAEKSEVIDATVMSHKALEKFLKEQVADAKNKNILFSVHLKATMMKVSDPVIFGYVLRAFFSELFQKFENQLQSVGANPNNGLADMLVRIENLPEKDREAILSEISQTLEKQPIAMVNSSKGITNLHVPSDVIIDASIPAMIRTSGQMWNAQGELQDTKIVIPDSSYAGIYQTVVDFCKQHGAFNPQTMGTVPNVGLMAQKAEEYGSHDKTFEISQNGTVKVFFSGEEIFSHKVEAGDLWRMCLTKEKAITDWVRLAVERAKITQTPAIFWLDKNRAHDAQLIQKVEECLKKYDLSGLDIRILPPEQAMLLTLQRLKNGEDTISVTGNVLRDYLTDLFPILELGTSAKMLSIVPLISGGGLFETGAGGSAPKHVQQFLQENHLRWDSLGEFLALTASLEHLSRHFNNKKALILSQTLDKAIEQLLENNESPLREVKQFDNRSSHYCLAMHWAKQLAEQQQDAELAKEFQTLAKELEAHKNQILTELNQIQGSPVDLGGYYAPEQQKVQHAMRPIVLYNEIITKK